MDAFIGEIRMLPYTFAPDGWLLCAGGSYSIREYQTLYAVIGTIYGGDGQTTFKVPNLSGGFPIGTGQGPGLTNRPLGSTGGENAVTLSVNTSPTHTHSVVTDGIVGSTPNPAGQYTARDAFNNKFLNNPDVNTLQPMANQSLSPAGAATVSPHENRQPCLALNFCINYNGTFPSRP